MNQIETIAHFEKNFNKVVASKGATSPYSTYAFFQLQAVMMGKCGGAVYIFADAEMERLKEITLECL